MKNARSYTGNGRSDRQRDGTHPEEEADGLRGARRAADVEGNRPEHGDEAAVEEAHDEGEYDHGLELEVAEEGRGRQEHRAQADGDEAHLKLIGLRSHRARGMRIFANKFCTFSAYDSEPVNTSIHELRVQLVNWVIVFLLQ